MTTQVKEFAKQTIDRLSDSETQELMEFLNTLIKNQTVNSRENYREIRQALDNLRTECLHDNWDGYGAKALQSGAYSAALRFLQQLPPTIPEPDLAVDPDGMVAFEWINGARKAFSISIGNHGELVYAGIFENCTTHGTEFLDERFPKILVDHLQRIFL